MKKGHASIIAFLSVFLALTCIGLFLSVIFKLQLIEQDIKENFLVEVVLSADATKETANQLQKSISGSDYCLNTKLIDKEEALTALKSQMGNQIADFLEVNPLYHSILIHLKSSYLSSYQLAIVSSKLKEYKEVAEVNYSDSALLKLERILPVAKFIILITTATLIFFALLVMFFITRLTLSFDRVKIETLKMFGAKKSFIALPYILQSFLLALLASVLALVTIGGIGYYLESTFSGLNLSQDLLKYGVYSLSIIIFAVLFIPLSTIFALIRFLK